MDEPKAEDLLRAAGTIARLAQQQKDMVIAAEALTRIGSLHLSAQEAEERAAKANAEADRLSAGVADLMAQRRDAEEDAEKILAEARAQAGVLLSKASAEVAVIVSDSQARATAIKKEAEALAQRIAGAANVEAELARDERQKHEEGAKEALRQVGEARETLTDLDTKIAAARQKMKEMMA